MQDRRMEVSKEIYDRAKAASSDPNQKIFPVLDSDQRILFGAAVFCGYGLYRCVVYEKDGKYICKYTMGDSCD